MSDIQSPPVPKAPVPAGSTEREFTVKERTQWQIVVRRFLRHRLAVVSLIVLILLILLAYIGPLVWIHKLEDLDSPTDIMISASNPMGTDSLGHDMFARVLRGMQQSIKVAVIVAVLSTGIGAPYGAIAGYFGGRVDTILMRICDVLLTLPLLLVAGALVTGRGGSVLTVALVLGLLGWVVNARVVRGVVLSLREQEFIEAAKALGAGTFRIVFNHLLPNATGAIIVQATLDIAAAILAESALSFVGLGVQPPDTSLGVLVNDARSAVETRPWLFYWPGIMIILIALTISFIGDGLRDAFDPRQMRQRR
ncbi:ABC transporter permease [Virgisporangium aliadipatigenens]|uniref:Oligopeptide transport system permease protein OppC n=1 Tax=Virgisporangium aliadipatigenens TaxID=741659 RepID=A0A8J4DVD4_9ACTN|nr:ABC transporter permease [Virgisporangium aliadipatigenens]GIJ51058.1 ABC transporter permease [Virgisporangium aliadipatigenens]